VAPGFSQAPELRARALLSPFRACANNREQITNSIPVRFGHGLEPTLKLLERDDVGRHRGGRIGEISLSSGCELREDNVVCFEQVSGQIAVLVL